METDYTNFEFSFEKLDTYKEARALVTCVYRLSSRFPKTEAFGLCSQIQRAVVSIASNIAEGCGRASYKEKIHFLEIAYGSLLETYCQLQLSLDLSYISDADFTALRPRFFALTRLISALSKSYQHKLNQQTKP